MAEIKFFTPVEYGNHATNFFQKLIEQTDFYFYLGGRKIAEIIPGNIKRNSQAVILKDEKAIWWKTALKVASYFTIILPVLIFLTKIILRKKYHFHTYPHEKEWPEFSPKKEKLIKKIKDIQLRISCLNSLRKHTKRIEVDNMQQALDCMKLCPNLKTFKISDKRITNEGLTNFSTQDLPKLENLTITSLNLPRDEEEEEWAIDRDFFISECPAGIKALVDSNKFPNLIALNLRGIHFRLSAIAESRNLSKLKSLRIRDAGISDERDKDEKLFQAFVSHNFQRLKTLDLSDNYISKIQNLASSQNFPNLQILNLGDNRIKDIQPLADSNNFSNLRVLKFDCSKEGCIREFANSPNFPKLKKLVIYNSRYSISDIEFLLNSPNFPHLKYIGIRANKEQVKILSQLPNFHKLRIKDLIPGIPR